MKQKTVLTILLLISIGIIPVAGIWKHMVTKAPGALFEESAFVKNEEWRMENEAKSEETGRGE